MLHMEKYIQIIRIGKSIVKHIWKMNHKNVIEDYSEISGNGSYVK